MVRLISKADRNWAEKIANAVAVSRAKQLAADDPIRRAVESAERSAHAKYDGAFALAKEHDARCVWPGTERLSQVEADRLAWVVRSAARRARLTLAEFYRRLAAESLL